jgi:hypothetical protein
VPTPTLRARLALRLLDLAARLLVRAAPRPVRRLDVARSREALAAYRARRIPDYRPTLQECHHAAYVALTGAPTYLPPRGTVRPYTRGEA